MPPTRGPVLTNCPLARRSLHRQLQHYEAIHKDSMAQLVDMSRDMAGQAAAVQQHRQQAAAVQGQVAVLRQELSVARSSQGLVRGCS